jgi:hypothetical protein
VSLGESPHDETGGRVSGRDNAHIAHEAPIDVAVSMGVTEAEMKALAEKIDGLYDALEDHYRGLASLIASDYGNRVPEARG